MPLVPGDAETFEGVYEETHHSVVGLMINDKAAGAGLIIHISPRATVLAVPSLCTQDLGLKSITVVFFDGTTSHTNYVVPLNGGLDLLFVENSAHIRTPARLGQLKDKESETVLTIVPLVEFNRHWQRTYTSQIISPCCTCVNITGSKVHKTSALFSFTLPVGNTNWPISNSPERKWLRVDDQVYGAPVFNIQKEWIGFPVERAASSHDMKLGMRGEVFRSSLNNWLAGRQWEDVLQPFVDEIDELIDIFDWYKD